MNNIELLDRLENEDIIICGSAHSIKRFSPDFLNKREHQTIISLNNAFLYDGFDFDAVIAADYSAFRENDDFFKRDGKMVRLLGRLKGPEECIIPDKKMGGSNTVSFDIADTADSKDIIRTSGYSSDIINAPLRFSKSIAITALQIALYLRPKHIYLVGLDFSQEGHFNDDEEENDYNERHKIWVNEHWKVHDVKRTFLELKGFADSLFSEVEIISVNPVTLKGIFKDVYMDKAVPRVTGYIGVKAHSVRLPGKNTLPFGKSNLLLHKIDQMKRTLNIGRIIVSTDSVEMLEMAEESGVEGIKRPVEYANETRPYQDFIKYLTEILPGEHIMRCPVTAPLCDADVLSDSISRYFWALDNGYDSLTSVLRFQHHMLDEKGPMNYTMDKNHKGSQNLPVWHMIANCMDIEPMDIMKESLFQFGFEFYRYEVDKITATDIDDKMDYEIACGIYEHMNNGGTFQ